MSKNQPGGEAGVCVKQKEQNSQRPKNEREHDGGEAVTEAHLEQGRRLVRDEAEGTQYRGQFMRAYLQVTGHNFNFTPRVSGVIEGD